MTSHHPEPVPITNVPQIPPAQPLPALITPPSTMSGSELVMATRDGYGTEWGLTILPNFLTNGGNIAILPNDKWDRMRDLINAPQTPVYSIIPLSSEEARLYHPLYAATDAITNTVTAVLRCIDWYWTLLCTTAEQRDTTTTVPQLRDTFLCCLQNCFLELK
jgi:hypothetical protein